MMRSSFLITLVCLFGLLFTANAQVTRRQKAAIYCPNGVNTLTCTNAGGLSAGNSQVSITTNATSVRANELFTLVCVDAANSKYALKTSKGNFVTFVGAGGKGGPNDNTSPLHTDAKGINAWEKYTLEFYKNGKVAIKCPNGKNYLSAVNGGGVSGSNVIHTDAKWADSWEMLTIKIIK